VPGAAAMPPPPARLRATSNNLLKLHNGSQYAKKSEVMSTRGAAEREAAPVGSAEGEHGQSKSARSTRDERWCTWDRKGWRAEGAA
jgi:hypothetical protein